MTSDHISKRIVADRLDLIETLLREIRALPLGDRQTFFADRRNIWAAESCLRKGLEALFDLGRHILANGYGLEVSEYKEIILEFCEKLFQHFLSSKLRYLGIIY